MKHIGYKFAIKIIHLKEKGQDIEFYVNPNHNSHELRSQGDFLPFIHTSKCNRQLCRDIELVEYHSTSGLLFREV